ncbi:MAG: glycosyltransferase family 2 protein [Candidatus Roizmanbacteria bacterium]
MYKGLKIGLSIPAHNEEELIINTIKSVEKYVDFITVVDDKSLDNTSNVVKILQKNESRLHLITHKKNTGIGGSIIDAHKYNISQGADILVVIAGDDQMDQTQMYRLLDSILDGNDYAKGNRLDHKKELKYMPFIRKIGNIIASYVFKITIGYWSISDPLNGYTALKVSSYNKLNKQNIGTGFEFELSVLGELSMINAKVVDVAIPARYGKEVSDIKIIRDAKRMSETLLKIMGRRAKEFIKL